VVDEEMGVTFGGRSGGGSGGGGGLNCQEPPPGERA